MKKYSGILATLILGSVFFTSCSKSSEIPASATNPATNDVTANLGSGFWVISSLTEHGEDKAGKFSGYRFEFLPSGVMKASKNGVETQGTWQYTAAVTYYGSSSTAAIAISLGNNSPFDILTGKWNMVSSTSSTLKVDSPEIAQAEHLVFTRQ